MRRCLDNEDRCLKPVFGRCLKVMGERKVIELIAECHQKHGEILTTDGARPRSIGGIFLHALKMDDGLNLSFADKCYIFKGVVVVFTPS